jgi:uncharacterized membrane protein YbhN (UPF0104 family)
MIRKLVSAAGWLLLLISVYLVLTRLEARELVASFQQLMGHPDLIVLMTLGYGAAFWLRSLAWSSQLGGRVPVRQLWHFHHIGLLLNHLLPIKGGELARAALLRAKHRYSWGEALLAVGTNRLLDVAGLLFIAGVSLLLVAPPQVRAWYGDGVGTWALLAVLLMIALLLGYVMAKAIRSRFLERYLDLLVKQPYWFAALALTVAGWLLEAVVVWSVVTALQGELGVAQALLVHVLTIVGQTFHVTPGGIGTYEAVMSTLLHQVAGHTLSFALQVAIVSHGYKFLYSFVVGGLSAWRLSLLPLDFFRRAEAERMKAEE